MKALKLVILLILISGCSEKTFESRREIRDLKPNDTCYYQLNPTIRRFVVVSNDEKNGIVVANVENALDRNWWYKDYFTYEQLDQWLVRP